MVRMCPAASMTTPLPRRCTPSNLAVRALDGTSVRTVTMADSTLRASRGI